MKKIAVKTNKKKEVIDITDIIDGYLSENEAKSGQVTVTVLHTTAAISTGDLDPGTDLDMLDAYGEMIPKLTYRHPHDPSHAGDHIISTLIGPGVTLPVENGALILGTWQRVLLFEFDGPRERQAIINFLPN